MVGVAVVVAAQEAVVARQGRARSFPDQRVGDIARALIDPARACLIEPLDEKVGGAIGCEKLGRLEDPAETSYLATTA